MKVCNHPHCNSQLAPQNQSGVCKEHVHLKPWCKCNLCMGRKGRYTKGNRPPPPEPTLKAYREPGMPKLPWEQSA